MSFTFHWPQFGSERLQEIREKMSSVMNAGQLPSVLAAPLTVTELEFGDTPPVIDLLEVSEASLVDGFGVKFALSYDGAFSIKVETVVRTSPFDRLAEPSAAWSKKVMGKIGVLAAHKPALIPVNFGVKRIALDGVLVIRAGLDGQVNAYFVENPLKDINVESSLDVLPPVHRVLNFLIFSALRHFFMFTFPHLVANATSKKKQNHGNHENQGNEGKGGNKECAGEGNADLDGSKTKGHKTARTPVAQSTPPGERRKSKRNANMSTMSLADTDSAARQRRIERRNERRRRGYESSNVSVSWLENDRRYMSDVQPQPQTRRRRKGRK